jgi:hypothetical protein
MPESHHRELAPPSKLKGKPAPSRTSLRSPPMPETPLREFVVLRHPGRSKPHQETGSIAAAPLAWARLAMVPVTPGLRNKPGALTCMPQYIHEVALSMVNNI